MTYSNKIKRFILDFVQLIHEQVCQDHMTAFDEEQLILVAVIQ